MSCYSIKETTTSLFSIKILKGLYHPHREPPSRKTKFINIKANISNRIKHHLVFLFFKFLHKTIDVFNTKLTFRFSFYVFILYLLKRRIFFFSLNIQEDGLTDFNIVLALYTFTKIISILRLID